MKISKKLKTESYWTLGIEYLNSGNFQEGIQYLENYIDIIGRVLKPYSTQIIRAHEQLGDLCIAHGRYIKGRKSSIFA